MFFALIVPITPIVINVVVTFGALAGFEVLRTRFSRASLVRRLLKKHLALLEHYRTSPPRHFAYYLLFPLLAPVLFVVSRSARREIKLYRRYVFANLLLLVLLKVREHQTLWAPELSFSAFAKSTAIVLAFQLVFVLVLVVPVIVTVVDYRGRRQTKRLAALSVIFAASSALTSAAYLSQPEGKLVPVPVCARMRARSEAAPERAAAAREAAVDAAEQHLGEGQRKKRRRGEELLGKPIEAARAELARFYKQDETACFRLFSVADPSGEPLLVLQGDSGRKKLAPIWAARRAGKTSGRVIDDVAELGGADGLRDLAR